MQRELRRAERDAGEDPILGEEEVAAQAAAGEEVFLAERVLLLIAHDQREELRLEGVAPRIPAELAQERVVLHALEHQPRAEARGEDAGEAGLAHADGAFHHDVSRTLGHLVLARRTGSHCRDRRAGCPGETRGELRARSCS